MVAARPAARFLRVEFRRPFGERRRLAFPASANLLDQLLELGDALLQLRDPPRLYLGQLAEPDDLDNRYLRSNRPLRARRIVVSRNSPVYTTVIEKWWIPLNEYVAVKHWEHEGLDVILQD